MARHAVITLFVASIILCGSYATAQNKGTFQAGIDYSAGPATVSSNTGYLGSGILPLEAHIGDFNGDGKPDVVVAAGCGGGYPGCPASGYAIVVYLSNGDGTFQPGSFGRYSSGIDP